jgi:hypothetical protein
MMFVHKGNTTWSSLKDLDSGSRVGLAIYSDRSLHLYVDEQDRGVIANNLPDTCFFMFDLFARCTKVLSMVNGT